MGMFSLKYEKSKTVDGNANDGKNKDKIFSWRKWKNSGWERDWSSYFLDSKPASNSVPFPTFIRNFILNCENLYYYNYPGKIIPAYPRFISITNTLVLLWMLYILKAYFRYRNGSIIRLLLFTQKISHLGIFYYLHLFSLTR